MTTRHPGLNAILGKLQRQEELSADDLARLQRQLDELEGRKPESLQVDGESAGLEAIEAMQDPVPGIATREGGQRLAARTGVHGHGFYRDAQGMLVSSLGIGTYHGNLDDATDAAYAHAVHVALRSGINLIDTAINYRHQRSERSVAAGLRRFFEREGGQRDEVVVCTKGGYLVPGAVPEHTLSADDIAGGAHCMSPAFLADQIARSRRNLGIQTIDVYYLHNPESQLRAVDVATFQARIRLAFEQLESAVSDGLIRYYGTATWDGYRGGGLSLSSLADIARDIAGDRHHFRFIQLPVNLAAQEAITLSDSSGRSVLTTAEALGITAVASASLFQGRLARHLPREMAQTLAGLDTDAQRAIQFTRSTPGVTAALVGMRQARHVTENARVASVPPLDRQACERLMRLSRGQL